MVAFVTSSLWYSLVFGAPYLSLRGLDPADLAAMSMSPLELVVELLRTVAVASVVAQLVTRLGISDWKAALRLGVGIWFGFSAMMWVGAILHDHTPWQLAAIHSGELASENAAHVRHTCHLAEVNRVNVDRLDPVSLLAILRGRAGHPARRFQGPTRRFGVDARGSARPDC
jgi:hypothetical protein